MKSTFFSLRRLKGLLVTLFCCLFSLAIISPDALAETYTVKMGSDNGSLVFQPAIVTVKQGDVVQWVNNKLPPHNIIFDSSKIPAEASQMASTISHPQLMIKPGETYELSISENLVPGEYDYYCVPHRGAGMAAKIIVEG